ncbi:MAG: hypothetical protein J3K34DRAFT_412836 [Monoraphidium minutum]|nr:MAG: hypothetical protein J3K34DRAFT_412836 [Monoraphidium minutum]
MGQSPSRSLRCGWMATLLLDRTPCLPGMIGAPGAWAVPTACGTPVPLLTPTWIARALRCGRTWEAVGPTNAL